MLVSNPRIVAFVPGAHPSHSPGPAVVPPIARLAGCIMFLICGSRTYIDDTTKRHSNLVPDAPAHNRTCAISPNSILLAALVVLILYHQRKRAAGRGDWKPAWMASELRDFDQQESLASFGRNGVLRRCARKPRRAPTGAPDHQHRPDRREFDWAKALVGPMKGLDRPPSLLLLTDLGVTYSMWSMVSQSISMMPTPLISINFFFFFVSFSSNILFPSCRYSFFKANRPLVFFSVIDTRL